MRPDLPILVITRPKPEATEFHRAIQRALGADVETLLSPATKIVALDVPQVPAPDHLIFTSSRGVEQAARLGLPSGTNTYCVGAKTARAASEARQIVSYHAKDSDALLAHLLAMRPEGRILHISGRHQRGDIVERLQAVGCQAQRVEAYDQVAQAPSEALIAAGNGSTSLIVPLFSKRAATILKGWNLKAPLQVVAISQDVAKAAQAMNPESVSIAQTKDAQGMLDATCKHLRSRV